MLRVAIVTDTMPDAVGGVERFVISMKEYLAKRNMIITVYDRSSIVDWRDKWYDKFVFGQRRNMLLGNIAWEKISSHGAGADVIIQNRIAGWNLRQKTKIPRIVVHHGTLRGLASMKLPSGVDWRTKLNRYIGLNRICGGLEQYNSTGAISVAVSGAVAEELMKYYSGIKSVVIPNGIDIRHFSRRDSAACRQKYGIALNEFVVCFTGRYALGKGFEELHALAVLAWEEQLRIKFLIATDELPQGWPSNVLFVKNADYDNMPELYSAADVFVFPTRYEGCSYSLIEAMACELPVLTGNVGYARDLCRDSKEIAPFLFDENSVELYWKSLKHLAGNEILARRLGTVGCEYVRRFNTLDVMADSYAKLIEQAAKGNFCITT